MSLILLIISFRPTPPIDPDILKSMTIRQFVGYAPNPKKGKRNQVRNQLKDEVELQVSSSCWVFMLSILLLF